MSRTSNRETIKISFKSVEESRGLLPDTASLVEIRRNVVIDQPGIMNRLAELRRFPLFNRHKQILCIRIKATSRKES
ncbi:hypothetical protein PDUR_06990 [Paenibacillus durus]|uniref:Uncharacterized protein n=1 Tax=Paenibacillus durus TaxID=44251 RepID=A0A089HLX2_PAEDU|nr:hypothetical protein PDUR_06990 [Paenibacillus durus]